MPRSAIKRALLFLTVFFALRGHDVITTPITWDREISRIVYARCASCHRPDGTAFSLMTYAAARPWAVAIKEEAQNRRMPPWGAVKGFGDFRNDRALTPEQLELIVSWASGGVPEGNPKDLPPEPKFDIPPPERPQHGVAISGDLKLPDAVLLDGLWPQHVSDNASFQITAVLPDGSVEPLLWLFHYRPQFGHPFLFRAPVALPRGSIIRGVPAGATVALLNATRAPSPARRSGPY